MASEEAGDGNTFVNFVFANLKYTNLKIQPIVLCK
jgi:hypothetical protein